MDAKSNAVQAVEEEVVAEEIPSIIEFSEDVDTQEAPSPLPAGVFIGEIQEATVQKSKAGKLYCKTVWLIGSDQYPADFVDGPDEGVLLMYFRAPLEDNAGARSSLRRFCEAVGYTVKKHFDASELLGLQARLTIVHDSYNGTRRASIKELASAE